MQSRIPLYSDKEQRDKRRAWQGGGHCPLDVHCTALRVKMTYRNEMMSIWVISLCLFEAARNAVASQCDVKQGQFVVKSGTFFLAACLHHSQSSMPRFVYHSSMIDDRPLLSPTCSWLNTDFLPFLRRLTNRLWTHGFQCVSRLVPCLLGNLVHESQIFLGPLLFPQLAEHRLPAPPLLPQAFHRLGSLQQAEQRACSWDAHRARLLGCRRTTACTAQADTCSSTRNW